MDDITYEFMSDCRDKKVTARSARSTRTHNGKRGAVKFPSDYLTKKERTAMNGKVETYRLNEPMTWDNFKQLPEDLMKDYIKAIREKFNAPDSYIAEMMGISHACLGGYIRTLGLGRGKDCGSRRTWDKERFLAWSHGVDICAVNESAVEVEIESAGLAAVAEVDTDELVAVNENPEIVTNEDDTEGRLPDICTNPYHYMPVIPKNGSMTFEHNHADDALATIKALLSNIKVNLTVSWESIDE